MERRGGDELWVDRGLGGDPGSSPRLDVAVLEAGFAALDDGVTIHDESGRLIACNPAATRIFGLAADELLGRQPDNPALKLRFIDGAVVDGSNSRVLRVLASGEPERGVAMQFVHPVHGRRRWVKVNLQPLSHEGAGRPWGVVCSCTDITASTDPESTLQEFSRQLRTILGDESAIAFLKDRDGRYLFANRALGQLFGLDRGQVVGRTDDELLPPELADACRASDRRVLEERTVLEVEEVLGRGDDAKVYLTIKFPLLDDADAPYAIAGISTDVTERRRAEEALRARAHRLTHLAFHDPLTGLANRWLLEEEIPRALARARREGRGVGLLALDVDNLKAINDTLGHAAGDDLLRQFARRLEDVVRETDVLVRQVEVSTIVGGAAEAAGTEGGGPSLELGTTGARHGGDEFVLLVADIEGDPAAAIDLVRGRIEASLAAPFVVAGEPVPASVSVGVGLFPRDGDTAEALLDHADAAMYRMKQSGRRGGR